MQSAVAEDPGFEPWEGPPSRRPLERRAERAPRMVAVDRVAISGQGAQIRHWCGSAGSKHLSGEGAWTAVATVQVRALSYSEQAPHRDPKRQDPKARTPRKGAGQGYKAPGGAERVIRSAVID